MSTVRPPSVSPPSRGKTAAVFLGASVSVLAIGILNVLARVSKPTRAFLILSKALGPWSGKVTLGYLAGLVSWFIAWTLLRKRNCGLTRWIWILYIASTVALLLVLPPFLGLFIKK